MTAAVGPSAPNPSPAAAANERTCRANWRWVPATRGMQLQRHPFGGPRPGHFGSRRACVFEPWRNVLGLRMRVLCLGTASNWDSWSARRPASTREDWSCIVRRPWPLMQSVFHLRERAMDRSDAHLRVDQLLDLACLDLGILYTHRTPVPISVICRCWTLITACWVKV